MDDTAQKPPEAPGTDSSIPPSSPPPSDNTNIPPSGPPVTPPPQPTETPTTPSSLSSVLDNLSKQPESTTPPNDPPAPPSPPSQPADPPPPPAPDPSQTTATPPSTPTTQTDPPSTNGKSRLTMYAVVGVISLVAVGSILFLSQQTAKPEPVTTTESQAAPSKAAELMLTIDSPTDNIVVANNTLAIKGKTLPHTTVVYFTDSEDGSAESDSDGNFQGTITLADGINKLTITAFGEGGEEKSETLTIVYDSQS